MESNFIRETQNNKIEISDFTSTSLIKTEDKNKMNSITQFNNLSNNMNINEVPKIITNISTNIIFPQNNDQTININTIKNINNRTQIINLKGGNRRYKELIKKIALQLKTRTKTPTEGFFHFVLLKGEYPFIIIKKISKQIINHQIELNNNIFKIYIKKYYKYRELIKRIAHLLKLSMNKKKPIINNIANEKTSIFQNNIKTNIINNGNQNIECNINLDNNNNDIIKTTNNDISIAKINEYNDNKEKMAIIKSEDMNKKVKIDNVNAHTNIFNQQKNKSQANKSNKLFANNHNFNNNHYNRNYISDKRINPINPFIASKEKIFHLKSKNFSKNRNNTISNIPNSNNQNSKTINVNLNNNHNKIKNSEIIKNEKNGRKTVFKEALFNNKKENLSPIPIFSEIPSDSKFAELTKDIDIEDNFQKLSPLNNINISNNIFMNNKERTNIISSSILNNEITSNNDININLSKENNISIENNYNSDSKNNITLSSINNDENKNIFVPTESIKDKNKNIQIKLSSIKKDYEPLIEEEKTNNSNIESQKTNLENIRNINCNAFKGNNSTEISDEYDDILYKEDISTSVDENSFLKKFELFLSYNNIIVQNYLPLALNKNSQKYLKKNIFWEKYINYIYFNYICSNGKISLFCLIHIIEQYFLWCENLNQQYISEFKKLIIETINKIFNLEEIKQFCSINKINNLDDLFGKYIIFQKINKNKDIINYKYDKEVEIKINQEVECKCDLCKSEYACMKKLSEINKNLNTEFKSENLFLEAKQESYKHLNEKNSSGRKISYDGESKDENNNFIFKKNKTLHSFVAAYEYISDKNEKSSHKRRRSSLINSSGKKSINSDKKESKGTNEDKNSNKIENYFSNEKEKNEKERNIDDDKSDKVNKSKGKNKKKKGRKKSYKEEKSDSDNESEEEIKIKKKKKGKKSRKKEKEKKYNDSDSDNESDNETKIKNKKEFKKNRKYSRVSSKKNV